MCSKPPPAAARAAPMFWYACVACALKSPGGPTTLPLPSRPIWPAMKRMRPGTVASTTCEYPACLELASGCRKRRCGGVLPAPSTVCASADEVVPATTSAPPAVSSRRRDQACCIDNAKRRGLMMLLLRKVCATTLRCRARPGSFLAERCRLRELLARGGDIGALALEKILDCAPQGGIDDVVRGIGRDRQVAARDLVLALGAGLDAAKLVLDGVLDRLVIAQLEMQERMVLDRAPMAAEQRVGADEINGAGDEAAVALGHHQQDAVGHLFPDQRIELPREVGAPPFARAGLHVKLEERVPHALGEVGAGEPMHADAGGERILALAPDGLALTRGERRQERVERVVAGILPVELLVGALEEAAAPEQLPFRLGREGDVHRGRMRAPADVDQRIRERRTHRLGLRSWAREQPRAGRRGERHGDLELGIVAAAGALVGFEIGRAHV